MRILSTLILSAISIGVFAQTIDQVGFSFSPAVLAVDAGQTIMITIGSPHTFTEVTEEIWNANGNTPNGGFNFNAGTHELTLNTQGTYYYVCIPHYNSGMKGQIIVLDGSGMAERPTNASLGLFPNPANNVVRITTAQEEARMVTLIDVQGREVLHQQLNGLTSLDISGLEQGNYVVVLTNTSRTILARERLTIAH